MPILNHTLQIETTDQYPSNMLRRFSILIFLILIFIVSCKTNKLNHELKVNEYMKNLRTPLGTINISDNLFLDETEVSNFSYMEFVWWTKRVYGETEYSVVFPNENSWDSLGDFKFYYFLKDYYLQYPFFRYYPVVGVSYEQAVMFCKWRSDRVLEYILIKYKIISYNPNPNKDSAFTIERYFSGNYQNIKPNPYIKYYPVYSLPDSLTYVKALGIADSLKLINYKKRSKNPCINELFQTRCLETIPKKCDSLRCGIEPTKLTYCEGITKSCITNLLGNVREMTNKNGLSFGGSFIDPCLSVNSKYFYRNNKSNAYTGFRCECSWKKWP